MQIAWSPEQLIADFPLTDVLRWAAAHAFEKQCVATEECERAPSSAPYEPTLVPQNKKAA